MARKKNFEIIRRLGVASRTTNAPQLQVNADQDAARGAGGLMTGIAGVMGDALPIVEKVKTKIDTDNLEAGKLAQAEAALAGKSAKDDPRYAANQKFREGVDIGDSLVRMGDMEKTLITEVAQLEPNSDIDEFLNKRITELMGDTSAMNPTAKEVLITGLGKVRETLVNNHLNASIKESVQQQSDAMSALAAKGIQDKSLFTAEGREKFIGLYIDKPEFGYLTRRDIMAAMADAASEEIASGRVDPTEALAAFSANNPDGTPGLATIPKFREELEAAAKVGQAVRDKAREDALRQAEADSTFEMDDLANAGRMTDARINAYAKRFGREDDPAWKLRWRNANQAAIQRMQEAAEKARREREEAQNLMGGNPLFLTDDKVGKQLDGMLKQAPIFALDAKGNMVPTNNTMRVLRVSAQVGVVPPALKNLLQRVSPQDPQGWANAVQIYRAANRVDPTLAAKFGDAKSIGLLHAYTRLTTTGGYTDVQAREALVNKVYDPAVGKSTIASVWGTASKELTETTSGVALANPFGYKQMIRAKAEIYAATGVLGPEEAIEAARKDVEAETTIIGGRLASRVGMPKGAERATTELLDGIGKKLVAANKYPRGTQFFAAPSPRNPNQWVVINTADGLPAEDTNGAPIAFTPADIARGHAQWTSERAKTEVMTKQALRAAGFSGNNSGDPAAIKANLTAQIADLEAKAAAQEKTGGGVRNQYALQLRRQAGTLRKQLQAVETVQVPTGAKKEFIDFISGN